MVHSREPARPLPVSTWSHYNVRQDGRRNRQSARETHTHRERHRERERTIEEEIARDRRISLGININANRPAMSLCFSMLSLFLILLFAFAFGRFHPFTPPPSLLLLFSASSSSSSALGILISCLLALLFSSSLSLSRLLFVCLFSFHLALLLLATIFFMFHSRQYTGQDIGTGHDSICPVPGHKMAANRRHLLSCFFFVSNKILVMFLLLVRYLLFVP